MTEVPCERDVRETRRVQSVRVIGVGAASATGRVRVKNNSSTRQAMEAGGRTRPSHTPHQPSTALTFPLFISFPSFLLSTFREGNRQSCRVPAPRPLLARPCARHTRRHRPPALTLPAQKEKEKISVACSPFALLLLVGGDLSLFVSRVSHFHHFPSFPLSPLFRYEHGIRTRRGIASSSAREREGGDSISRVNTEYSCG